jgi:hypothetical protein
LIEIRHICLPTKDTTALQTLSFLIFPVRGTILATLIRIPDPDPLTQMNPDPGYETLLFTSTWLSCRLALYIYSLGSMPGGGWGVLRERGEKTHLVLLVSTARWMTTQTVVLVAPESITMQVST